MAIDGDMLVRLLIRSRSRILGYITAIVRDDHLAEDVFQDVSAIAYSKRDQIQNAEHFMGWLRIAARRQAFKALRDRESAGRRLSDQVLDLLERDFEQIDSGYDDRVVGALRGCLDALTPYNRQLVELRYAKDLTGRQISDQTGRDLNTIYVAMTRIHRMLRQCIAARLGKETPGE